MFQLKLEYYIPRSCSNYNCVCWYSGINGLCLTYDTCLRCYKRLNGLQYCPICDKNKN